MTTYNAPVRDIRFVLNELLAIENYRNLPGFEDASGDVVDAVLDEGAKICEQVIFPLNDPGDAEGCRFEDGAVVTPRGFKEAFATYAAGGWIGLDTDPVEHSRHLIAQANELGRGLSPGP